MTCYFGDKKSLQNAVLLLPFHDCLADGAKSLQGSEPPWPSPCKILSQSVPVCRSNFRKSDFVRLQYMPSAYNNNNNLICRVPHLKLQSAAE